MAAKVPGRNASLYYEDTSGASTSLSGDANSISFSHTVEGMEVTGFGDNTQQNLEGGIQAWELSIDGFIKEPGSTACDLRAIVQNGGATLIQYGFAGSTSGCPKMTACAVMTEFSAENTVTDAMTFSATFVPRSGSPTYGAWA